MITFVKLNNWVLCFQGNKTKATAGQIFVDPILSNSKRSTYILLKLQQAQPRKTMSSTGLTFYEKANFDPRGRSEILTSDAPDLTKEYPTGILSIKVGYEAGEWHAGTRPNDEKHNMAHLDQGRDYKDPSEMGLNAPVKCIVKAGDNH